jgi:tetratricopeptide (TPR) repeat protein
MMKAVRLRILFLALVAFFVMSCGGGARNFVGMRAVEVPPGVSPIVAVRADSIAAGLFVSMEHERKAQTLADQGIRAYAASDSLWSLLDAAKPSARKVSAEDSINAIKLAVTGAVKLQQAGEILQNFDHMQEQRLVIQSSYNLKEAQKYLEKSVQLNPFNTQVQNYLALTYKLLAQRFPKELTYDQALHIWGMLARLEPGEYSHFFNLGSTYFAQQNWRPALENFKKSEELLLASEAFAPKRLENPSLPVEAIRDTTTLFYAVWYQAQAAIKLYDAEPALHHLRRAKGLTHSSAILASIDDYINWINWDEGNILGAVMKDSAAALANNGKFVEAAAIYDDLVHKILKSERAKDEISLVYSLLEYKNLKRKISAITRLYAVVQSISKNQNGAAQDTTYQSYFDAYGTMCHNLGIDTLRSDRKLAYTYFSQAAEIHWRGRGKSYMAMADLSKANPTLLVQNAEKAVALSEQLASDELLALYKLLVDGYRRLNRMEDARVYFEKIKAMQ